MARVLVACEVSGKVRDAFRRRGHEAWSCDLREIPQDDIANHQFPQYHIVGDALDAMDGGGWDALIAFPECTYLTVSGMHWTSRGLRDPRLTEGALSLVLAFLNAPIKYIALENPVGIISTRIRPPDQIIQPYWFGHPEAKRTCLWLKNLPKLKPTEGAKGRVVKETGQIAMPWGSTGKERYDNQTDDGQNRLGETKSRATRRSETYDGVAEAMAQQWGDIING